MTDQIQTSIDRLRNKALELHQLVVKARHENQMLLNSNQALKDELDQQQTIGKNLLNENERLNQVIEASDNYAVSDTQDLLAMSTLQMMMKGSSTKIEKEVIPADYAAIESKLQSLTDELDQLD